MYMYSSTKLDVQKHKFLHVHVHSAYNVKVTLLSFILAAMISYSINKRLL